MKSIVVLSGKGGVGKSSISASLAVAFSKDKKIICADCDVDASNLSLLFSLHHESYIEWNFLSTNQIAVIDKEKCTQCGLCVSNCYFHALDASSKVPKVKGFSCEGCGACQLVCPAKAIRLQNVHNAHIGYAITNHGFKIVSAQILPGNSGSGRVVSEVRKKAEEISEDSEFMIIDSAAGIGCPVIASVTGTDYALIITEPTPSAFSDMKKALEIVNHFRIRCGIIINKCDINKEQYNKINSFAKENRIRIIKSIPFDKKFVDAMTNMVPLTDLDKGYSKLFEEIKMDVISDML